MANTAKIRDVDRGAKALVRRVAEAKDRKITVGIHESEAGAGHEKGATTVGDIATIHEYGLGNNPARSWLGSWAEEKAPIALQDMRKLGQAVVRGKVTVDQGLEQLALKYAGDCQANFPSITPGTGTGRTPLVDTNQMRGAIRGVVE